MGVVGLSLCIVVLLPPARVLVAAAHVIVDTEKLLVGYRYYDAHKIEFTTGFPFGHGLSCEPSSTTAPVPPRPNFHARRITLTCS